MEPRNPGLPFEPVPPYFRSAALAVRRGDKGSGAFSGLRDNRVDGGGPQRPRARLGITALLFAVIDFTTPLNQSSMSQQKDEDCISQGVGIGAKPLRAFFCAIRL